MMRGKSIEDDHRRYSRRVGEGHGADVGRLSIQRIEDPNNNSHNKINSSNKNVDRIQQNKIYDTNSHNLDDDSLCVGPENRKYHPPSTVLFGDSSTRSEWRRGNCQRQQHDDDDDSIKQIIEVTATRSAGADDEYGQEPIVLIGSLIDLTSYDSEEQRRGRHQHQPESPLQQQHEQQQLSLVQHRQQQSVVGMGSSNSSRESLLGFSTTTNTTAAYSPRYTNHSTASQRRDALLLEQRSLATATAVPATHNTIFLEDHPTGGIVVDSDVRDDDDDYVACDDGTEYVHEHFSDDVVHRHRVVGMLYSPSVYNNSGQQSVSGFSTSTSTAVYSPPPPPPVPLPLPPPPPPPLPPAKNKTYPPQSRQLHLANSFQSNAEHSTATNTAVYTPSHGRPRLATSASTLSQQRDASILEQRSIKTRTATIVLVGSSEGEQERYVKKNIEEARIVEAHRCYSSSQEEEEVEEAYPFEEDVGTNGKSSTSPHQHHRISNDNSSTSTPINVVNLLLTSDDDEGYEDFQHDDRSSVLAVTENESPASNVLGKDSRRQETDRGSPPSKLHQRYQGHQPPTIEHNFSNQSSVGAVMMKPVRKKVHCARNKSFGTSLHRSSRSDSTIPQIRRKDGSVGGAKSVTDTILQKRAAASISAAYVAKVGEKQIDKNKDAILLKRIGSLASSVSSKTTTFSPTPYKIDRKNNSDNKPSGVDAAVVLRQHVFERADSEAPLTGIPSTTNSSLFDRSSTHHSNDYDHTIEGILPTSNRNDWMNVNNAFDETISAVAVAIDSKRSPSTSSPRSNSLPICSSVQKGLNINSNVSETEIIFVEDPLMEQVSTQEVVYCDDDTKTGLHEANKYVEQRQESSSELYGTRPSPEVYGITEKIADQKNKQIQDSFTSSDWRSGNPESRDTRPNAMNKNKEAVLYSEVSSTQENHSISYSPPGHQIDSAGRSKSTRHGDVPSTTSNQLSPLSFKEPSGLPEVSRSNGVVESYRTDDKDAWKLKGTESDPLEIISVTSSYVDMTRNNDSINWNESQELHRERDSKEQENQEKLVQQHQERRRCQSPQLSENVVDEGQPCEDKDQQENFAYEELDFQGDKTLFESDESGSDRFSIAVEPSKSTNRMDESANDGHVLGDITPSLKNESLDAVVVGSKIHAEISLHEESTGVQKDRRQAKASDQKNVTQKPSLQQIEPESPHAEKSVCSFPTSLALSVDEMVSTTIPPKGTRMYDLVSTFAQVVISGHVPNQPEEMKAMSASELKASPSGVSPTHRSVSEFITRRHDIPTLSPKHLERERDFVFSMSPVLEMVKETEMDNVVVTRKIPKDPPVQQEDSFEAEATHHLSAPPLPSLRTQEDLDTLLNAIVSKHEKDHPNGTHDVSQHNSNSNVKQEADGNSETGAAVDAAVLSAITAAVAVDPEIDNTRKNAQSVSVETLANEASEIHSDDKNAPVDNRHLVAQRNRLDGGVETSDKNTTEPSETEAVHKDVEISEESKSQSASQHLEKQERIHFHNQHTQALIAQAAADLERRQNKAARRQIGRKLDSITSGATIITSYHKDVADEACTSSGHTTENALDHSTPATEELTLSEETNIQQTPDSPVVTQSTSKADFVEDVPGSAYVQSEKVTDTIAEAPLPMDTTNLLQDFDHEKSDELPKDVEDERNLIEETKEFSTRQASIFPPTTKLQPSESAKSGSSAVTVGKKIERQEDTKPQDATVQGQLKRKKGHGLCGENENSKRSSKTQSKSQHKQKGKAESKRNRSRAMPDRELSAVGSEGSKSLKPKGKSKAKELDGKPNDEGINVSPGASASRMLARYNCKPSRSVDSMESRDPTKLSSSGSENNEDATDNSETKMSIVDTLTTESDLEMEREVYGTCSVPYAFQLLDKTCAWLENENTMCGYKAKPSLYTKVKEGENERRKPLVNGHTEVGTNVNHVSLRKPKRQVVTPLRSEDKSPLGRNNTNLNDKSFSPYARPRRQKGKTELRAEEKEEFDRLSSPRNRPKTFDNSLRNEIERPGSRASIQSNTRKYMIEREDGKDDDPKTKSILDSESDGEEIPYQRNAIILHSAIHGPDLGDSNEENQKVEKVLNGARNPTDKTESISEINGDLLLLQQMPSVSPSLDRVFSTKSEPSTDQERMSSKVESDQEPKTVANTTDIDHSEVNSLKNGEKPYAGMQAVSELGNRHDSYDSDQSRISPPASVTTLEPTPTVPIDCGNTNPPTELSMTSNRQTESPKVAQNTDDLILERPRNLGQTTVEKMEDEKEAPVLTTRSGTETLSSAQKSLITKSEDDDRNDFASLANDQVASAEQDGRDGREVSIGSEGTSIKLEPIAKNERHVQDPSEHNSIRNLNTFLDRSAPLSPAATLSPISKLSPRSPRRGQYNLRSPDPLFEQHTVEKVQTTPKSTADDNSTSTKPLNLPYQPKLGTNMDYDSTEGFEKSPRNTQEEERMTALELAEKLRRRAASLKHRRRYRLRKPLVIGSGEGRLSPGAYSVDSSVETSARSVPIDP